MTTAKTEAQAAPKVGQPKPRPLSAHRSLDEVARSPPALTHTRLRRPGAAVPGEVPSVRMVNGESPGRRAESWPPSDVIRKQSEKKPTPRTKSLQRAMGSQTCPRPVRAAQGPSDRGGEWGDWRSAHVSPPRRRKTVPPPRPGMQRSGPRTLTDEDSHLGESPEPLGTTTSSPPRLAPGQQPGESLRKCWWCPSVSPHPHPPSS